MTTKNEKLATEILNWLDDRRAGRVQGPLSSVYVVAALEAAEQRGRKAVYEEVARWRCAACEAGNLPVVRRGKFLHGTKFSKGHECCASRWWSKATG